MSSHEQELSGRVAVITGASGGIGRATAVQLAASGAAVAILGRRSAELDGLAAEIRDFGGTALPLTVDVTKKDQLRAAAAEVEKELGPANILVPNAGTLLPASIADPFVSRDSAEGDSADGSDDDSDDGDVWQQQLDLNAAGVINTVRVFVPQLIASAESGAISDIVTISSVAAEVVIPLFSGYAGTKAYISQVSRVIRAELAPKNIRVSCIQPGLVDTVLNDKVTEPNAKEVLAQAKQAFEWLHADDVARSVQFVIAQPPHVRMDELTLTPTAQTA